MLLWGLLLGAVLLAVGGWFMHRFGQEGNASEVLALPSRLILTVALLGLVVFVYFTMGPIITLFLSLLVGLILGTMWVPGMVSLILSPLSDSLTGGTEQVEAKPYYSRAIGLRKRGEHDAAAAAVRAELAKFPGDAEGM